MKTGDISRKSCMNYSLSDDLNRAEREGGGGGRIDYDVRRKGRRRRKRRV